MCMFLQSVGRLPAPRVAHLLLQLWAQCVQRRKPTPALPYCLFRRILQNFCHLCDFPWQQGQQQALTGGTLAQALPPAASTTTLSSTALCWTMHTHNWRHQVAQETSLWSNLDVDGECVPLFGSPCHQRQLGPRGGKLGASTSGLSDQSGSLILPLSCQCCISCPRLFSDGGCYFSVRGAKRDLLGIKDIIFRELWLCCCFDFIILLQELGAKAGNVFQSASLRKCHNKVSCQCGSHTHAKTCMLKWLWKMSKKEMQTENSGFWAYVHVQLSHLKYVLVLALWCLAAAT